MEKFKVTYGQDYIAIDRYGEEVLYWDIQEWQNDPQVVFSICAAIELPTADRLDTKLKFLKII